jgi:hypothetical protein
MKSRKSQGRRISGGLFRGWVPARVILLHCKLRYAAMQTKQLKLASGIHNLLSERSEPLRPL